VHLPQIRTYALTAVAIALINPALAKGGSRTPMRRLRYTRVIAAQPLQSTSSNARIPAHQLATASAPAQAMSKIT
jgi:hypothetical protein